MSDNTTLGHAIFTDLEKNEYLNEIYNSILYNYAIRLLGLADNQAEAINLDDALRFTDILSKSYGVPNSEMHHLWAQEIVALLNELYPDDETVRYYVGSVLSTIGNFRGVTLRAEGYRSDDVLEQMATEIRKEYLKIPASPENYFFSAQKEIYDSFDASYFSYSAPTSLGKSYVMRMFIKEQIENNATNALCNYAIIVPSKALINEVTSSISYDLKSMLSEKDYRIVTSAGAMALEEPHNYIFIMTPERLLYLLIIMRDIPIEYLFIDEAHKISKKDGRSAFYYKVVDMLSQRAHRPHIIFASPNIPNPEVYLQLIPGVVVASDNRLATMYAPVNQEKFMIDLRKHEFHVYNEMSQDLRKLGSFDEQKGLLDFIRELGADKRTIVYCDSKDKVVNWAIDYARDLPELHDEELETLAEDIRQDVHGAYYLAQIITKGVAYHMGFLPAPIRIRIEEIYKRKDGSIKTLFSTSTLLEGVNLPADNLFITSDKNGGVMSAIEFRNLIGRVGRIEFNLYGNVFLICIPRKANVNRYLDLLRENIAPQQLSVVSALSQEQKEKIVASLRTGNAEMLFEPKQDPNEYSLMRRISSILLRDVMSSRNSRVLQEFAPLIANGVGAEIKEAFLRKESQPDDNISMTHDQIENLASHIRAGLHYPSITIGCMAKYEDIVAFLNELCDIFKWEKYESGTLGYAKVTDTGIVHSKLRWYAFILNKWISGISLKQMIAETIENNLKPDSNAKVRLNNAWVPFENTPEHINALISSMLETVDDVILFRLSNYFLKFSEVFKSVYPDRAFMDWYEFVEYGATDPLAIWLQRNGFTREAATYIRTNHTKYVIQTPDSMFLSDALLNCENRSIQREAKQVYYNNHELFLPDFLM